MSKDGWIGVDLDGTLAHYEGWVDELHIGEPVAPMVDRVRRWLVDGVDVRIFTARVYDGGRVKRDVTHVILAIQEWCVRHIGRALPVTNQKDYGMIELWDDRCVRVVLNTGERCCE